MAMLWIIDVCFFSSSIIITDCCVALHVARCRAGAGGGGRNSLARHGRYEPYQVHYSTI